MEFSPDALVNGRYRLIEEIGRGGMGTVWRGHDEMLDREVAIKVVRLPSDLDDEERAELTALALGEARATARLSHPGIITVFDVIDDDGTPIIVMELVDGRSLAGLLREEVRLPYRRVAEIGAEVLAALREAHAAGIVHRDLKPANVLIGERRVVVTDFGVAQRVGERPDEPGDVTGTPAYMAPEQAESSAASPAADLWSLGATLFHAVEGRPPYEGPDFVTTLLTLLTQDPPAPRNAGPLAPLITALLSKDPARRPSPEETAARLDAILNETGAPGGAAGGAGKGSPATAGPPAPSVRPAAPAAPPAPPAAPSTGTPAPDAGRPARPSSPSLPPVPSPSGLAGAGPIRMSKEDLARRSRGAGPAASGAAGSSPPPAGAGSRTAAPLPPRAGAPVGWALFVVAVIALSVVVLGYGFSQSGSAGYSSSTPTTAPSSPLDGLPGGPTGTPTASPSGSPTTPPALKGVTATALSPDGTVVAFGTESGAVRLYDTGARRSRGSFRTSTDGDAGVAALAFSPDGRLLAVGTRYGDIRIWDVTTHRQKKFADFEGVVEALRFSSDGRTVTVVDSKGAVGAYSARTGVYHRRRPIPDVAGGFCLTVAMSADGHEVACGYADDDTDEHGITVWDAERGRRIASWRAGSTDRGLALSADGGTVAFCSDDGEYLQLWDVASHREIGSLHTSVNSLENALTFSSDGKMLAVPVSDPLSGHDAVELWKVAGRTKIRTLTHDITGVYSLALGPRGGLVAVAEDGAGLLWQARSGKLLESWRN